MLKKLTVAVCLFALLLIPSMTQAQNSNRMIVTMVVASNSDNDFNMDNDAYRDKLTQLFSYSSYVQSDLKKLDMTLGETQNLALLEGYSLTLTLKEDKGSSIVARATITKDNKDYIDTELSIAKPGIFFMGGPTLSTGDLILILENGY